MNERYNDLGRELENVQITPAPPLVWPNVDAAAQRLAEGFRRAALSVEDAARGIALAIRAAQIVPASRKLLRRLGFLPPPHPPLPKRTAHGRLRSRRERRDIRRQRGL